MSNYNWRFFKSARTVQAKIENGEDFSHIAELDRRLWTVLSSPAKDLRFDQRTLELLDSDADGRIRVNEVLAAVDWLKPRLKSLDTVFTAPAEELSYEVINDATEEGKALLKALKDISAQSGKVDATSVKLADVAAIGEAFNGTAFNGDGVITSLSTSDAEQLEVIEAIASTEGAKTDRSGKDGIDQAAIDAFFTDAAAYTEWCATGRADAAIQFLGDRTATACAAFEAVEAKIDEFFTPPADMPLVTDVPDPELPLLSNINPLWADAFRKFAVEAAAPALGRDGVSAISRSDWAAVKAAFAPFRTWTSSKAGAAVEGIGEERLVKWLDGGKMKAQMDELVAKDLALADAHDRLVDAERLLRYAANLAEFAHNFINQADLYDPSRRPVYCAGSLYIASRVCNLCFYVADAGAHSALAEKSKCCLLYSTITRKGSAEKRTICAVVTAGLTAPLYAGRNGIFYDRDGGEWDAVVDKVVEAPVSLREAFWAPWKKLSETVAGQVRKFIGDRQDAATAGVTKAADGVAADASKPKAEAGGANAAALASSVAALGVGIGMMGAAFAGLIGLVAGLPWWKTCIAVLAVLLAVSLPSVILAYFKLRARDLGAILNAGGWAVNRPLYFSMKLARLFTRLAVLPHGAVAARDPYAGVPWVRIVVAVIVLGACALGVMWKCAIGPFAPCGSCAEKCAPSAESSK